MEPVAEKVFFLGFAPQVPLVYVVHSLSSILISIVVFEFLSTNKFIEPLSVICSEIIDCVFEIRQLLSCPFREYKESALMEILFIEKCSRADV